MHFGSCGPNCGPNCNCGFGKSCKMHFGSCGPNCGPNCSCNINRFGYKTFKLNVKSVDDKINDILKEYKKLLLKLKKSEYPINDQIKILNNVNNYFFKIFQNKNFKIPDYLNSIYVKSSILNTYISKFPKNIKERILVILYANINEITTEYITIMQNKNKFGLKSEYKKMFEKGISKKQKDIKKIYNQILEILKKICLNDTSKRKFLLLIDDLIVKNLYNKKVDMEKFSLKLETIFYKCYKYYKQEIKDIIKKIILLNNETIKLRNFLDILDIKDKNKFLIQNYKINKFGSN